MKPLKDFDGDWQKKQESWEWDGDGFIRLEELECKNWNFVEVGGVYRMYYRKHEPSYIDIPFDVYGLRLISLDSWDLDKKPEVEVLLQVRGSWDSARHLYLNPYTYYPDYKHIARMLTIIAEMEKHFLKQFEDYVEDDSFPSIESIIKQMDEAPYGERGE